MKTYYTHDNGSRPFKVVVDRTIEVYARDTNSVGKQGTKIKIEYNKKVLSTKYKKVFVGKPDGNSILVHVEKNTYIYIGMIIYKFSIADPITEYNSPIGNSDVPYPYAIGSKYTILLVENTYLPSDWIMTKDPYEQYYKWDRSFDKSILNCVKKLKVKVICKRIE